MADQPRTMYPIAYSANWTINSTVDASTAIDERYKITKMPNSPSATVRTTHAEVWIGSPAPQKYKDDNLPLAHLLLDMHIGTIENAIANAINRVVQKQFVPKGQQSSADPLSAAIVVSRCQTVYTRLTSESIKNGKTLADIVTGAANSAITKTLSLPNKNKPTPSELALIQSDVAAYLHHLGVQLLASWVWPLAYAHSAAESEAQSLKSVHPNDQFRSVVDSTSTVATATIPANASFSTKVAMRANALGLLMANNIDAEIDPQGVVELITGKSKAKLQYEGAILDVTNALAPTGTISMDEGAVEFSYKKPGGDFELTTLPKSAYFNWANAFDTRSASKAKFENYTKFKETTTNMLYGDNANQTVLTNAHYLARGIAESTARAFLKHTPRVSVPSTLQQERFVVDVNLVKSRGRGNISTVDMANAALESVCLTAYSEVTLRLYFYEDDHADALDVGKRIAKNIESVYIASVVGVEVYGVQLVCEEPWRTEAVLAGIVELCHMPSMQSLHIQVVRKFASPATILYNVGTDYNKGRTLDVNLDELSREGLSVTMHNFWYLPDAKSTPFAGKTRKKLHLSSFDVLRPDATRDREPIPTASTVCITQRDLSVLSKENASNRRIHLTMMISGESGTWKSEDTKSIGILERIVVPESSAATRDDVKWALAVDNRNSGLEGGSLCIPVILVGNAHDALFADLTKNPLHGAYVVQL